MSYAFNPFIANLDYYKDDYTFESHNADTTLVAGDLRKIHIMDVSGGERAFYLPHADTTLVGQWIGLMRKGVGNLLRVWANGTDVIFNSAAGGYLECADTHNYACIFLFVIEDGVWGKSVFWDMEYPLMANSFKNPILLDTFTSDIDVGESAFGISNTPLFVNHIEWQTPENTTHQAVITDYYGGVVFDEKCTVANQSIFKPFGGQIIQGLKIASGAVGSGKISIKLV